jgi:signal transduction histidine kinase
VTEKVLSRKKLEDSLRELEHERELRERFVSALSHDLRTPLSIVKMCAQFIKIDAENPKEIVGMAERISTSVDRADRMIRDLLDASCIKAGIVIPVTFQKCHLNQAVGYIVQDLKEVYGSRFQSNFSEEEIFGLWDSMAIQRMIENLLINAVKYGDPEEKITITTRLINQSAEILIHNSGNPISAEEQKYLFNQYSRLKSAIRSGQIGWGIGLSIVKAVVDAHGGAVCVESCKENGTTFTISLPITGKLEGH